MLRSLFSEPSDQNAPNTCLKSTVFMVRTNGGKADIMATYNVCLGHPDEPLTQEDLVMKISQATSYPRSCITIVNKEILRNDEPHFSFCFCLISLKMASQDWLSSLILFMVGH